MVDLIKCGNLHDEIYKSPKQPDLVKNLKTILAKARKLLKGATSEAEYFQAYNSALGGLKQDQLSPQI